MLWTPGTAQIGEGIENSWGHLEDSEKEDEDEGGSDEAVILDGVKMDPGVEVSNIGSQGMWHFMAICNVVCIYIFLSLRNLISADTYLEGLNVNLNCWG